MKVAITRPRDDAQKVADQFAAEGIEAVIVPMLRIEPVMLGQMQVKEAAASGRLQSVCATSRHAVRELAQHRQLYDVPLYAVGEATANEARSSGFKKVEVAAGSAQALLEKMLLQNSTAGGAILYARGRDITLDIAQHMKNAGFELAEAIVYKAVAEDRFPEEYVELLADGLISKVMFFSERSAANYVLLAQREKLEKLHGKIIAASISEKIAAKAAQLSWKENLLFSVS